MRAIKFFARDAKGFEFDNEVKHLEALSSETGFVQILGKSGPAAEWPYYVMPRYKSSLGGLFQQDIPVPTAFAIGVFSQLVEAMAYAHNRPKSLIHCDLKPGNILLNEQNKAFIADFGQAKFAGQYEKNAGRFLGTWGYMPPDQADWDNRQPEKRWDVYALGAIAYAMLTPKHKPPRWERAETVLSSRKGKVGGLTEVSLAEYRKVMEDDNDKALEEDLKKLPADVDRRFKDVLRKCLAAKAEKRYDSAGAILKALRLRERKVRQRPLVTLGILATLLSVIVVVGSACYVHGWVLDNSEKNLTTEIRDGQRDLARVAAEALEARFRERTAFLRGHAVSPQSEPARQALAKAVEKYRSRAYPPPFTWNDADRRPVAAWLREVNQDGSDRGLFHHRGASVAINADKRAYSFARCEYRADPTAAPWAIVPPFKDDPTVAHGGENYAFRDWFNGQGLSDGSEAEALKANGEFDPISRPHICTVYRSTQRDHSGTRPWIVEVVQPLRYPDRHTGPVVGVMTSGINVRLDLGGWLRNAGQSKADLRSAVWVIDGRGKLAWRNELHAQDDTKETKAESYAAVIEQLKDNERATDDRAGKVRPKFTDPLTKVELIAVRQPFYPLADDKDDANAWQVVVSQPRGQALQSVQQLSAEMIAVAGFAAAAFAAVAAVLWFAVYREYRKVSVPD